MRLLRPHTEVLERGAASALALHGAAVVWGHCEDCVGSKGGRTLKGVIVSVVSDGV